MGDDAKKYGNHSTILYTERRKIINNVLINYVIELNIHV